MSRTESYPRLEVFSNDRYVGLLRRESKTKLSFCYDHAWLKSEQLYPVSLSLPLQERELTGDAVTRFFDSLLPEGIELRQKIAEHVGAQGADTYSLIRRLCRDCAGAMHFRPLVLDKKYRVPLDTSLKSKPLSIAEVAQTLKNLSVAPLGLRPQSTFTLPGSTSKTAFLKMNDTWHYALGATPTSHILKPDCTASDIALGRSSIDNEYLCLKLCAAFGIPTPNVSLETFDGVRALVIERFDRQWAKPGHIVSVPHEDLCQALSVPAAKKLESQGGPSVVDILQLLQASNAPNVDRPMFVKAIIVLWLLGVTSGHGRNFSIRLTSGGGCRLAPLYNVSSSQPQLDSGLLKPVDFKFAMTVGSERLRLIDEIQPKHIQQTAARGGVGSVVTSKILDDILESSSTAINTVLSELPTGFPAALAGSIVGGFQLRLKKLLFDEASY